MLTDLSKSVIVGTASIVGRWAVLRRVQSSACVAILRCKATTSVVPREYVARGGAGLYQVAAVHREAPCQGYRRSALCHRKARAAVLTWPTRKFVLSLRFGQCSSCTSSPIRTGSWRTPTKAATLSCRPCRQTARTAPGTAACRTGSSHVPALNARGSHLTVKLPNAAVPHPPLC